MKNLILRLVFSRLGPSLTAGISYLVGKLLGWIVMATSAVEFHLTAAQQTEISLTVSAVIFWLLTQLVNKYAGEHSETLQSILQKANPTLKVDRWIGPETIAAVQASAQATANLSTGEIYEGKPVPKEPVKIKPKRKRVNPLKR
jgi:uncharacterized protein YacL